MAVDDSSYYILQYKRDLTGTYYAYTDRVYLCQRILADKTTKSKFLLQILEHRDTTTMGDWSQKNLIKNPINPISYVLGKQGIDLFYEESSYMEDAFTLDSYGLSFTP